MRQLTLIDMRPICPGCKQPVPFLAQWSPGDKSYLCKSCTEQFGNPDELFVPHSNCVGVGLQQGTDYTQQRQRYQSLAESLIQLRRGCSMTLSDWTEEYGLPCEHDRQARPECKRCLNLLRYDTQVEMAARKVAAQRGSNPEMAVALGNRYSIMAAKALRPSYNLSFPLCHRCGCVHDRKSISGDARVYCQQCDDELEVESYLKNKGIFEDPEDDEAILDKLHRLRRELFDRGILPDYWYTTKERLNVVGHPEKTNS